MKKKEIMDAISPMDLILMNEKEGNHGSNLPHGSHPEEWKRRKSWKQSLPWISSWWMKKKEIMEAISLMDLILMNEKEGNHGSNLSHGSHPDEWKRKKSSKQSLSWISFWGMKTKEIMEAISPMDLILMNDKEGNHGSNLSHGSHPDE